MTSQHTCQYNWPECLEFNAAYEIHGSEYQKEIYQLKCSSTNKNQEYRSLICQIYGIDSNNDRYIYLADYHWNPRLLELLGARYRTSMLIKGEPGQFDIKGIKKAYKKRR